MASPPGHLACQSTTQPVHDQRETQVSAEEQSSTSQAPPAVALLDLPAPLLIRISAFLCEKDLHSFTQACTATKQLLRANKPLYAVCRALGFKTRRTARLSAGLTQQVYRPHGQPQPVDALSIALSVHPGLTPGEVLCRPQLAEWMLWCAGLKGDERVMDWVLGISDASMACTLRNRDEAKYDRAWAVAAGAAAAGPCPSVFHALCAMPCAPGQPHGLSRAHRSFQTALLSFAVTGAHPDTALDMVMPLCWLPYKDPSKAGVLTWPWSDEGDGHGVTEIGAHGDLVVVALREAALHALRYGYTAALAPLSQRGAPIADVFVMFAKECETEAHGTALQTLFNTPYPLTQDRPLIDTISQSILRRVWWRALHKLRPACLRVLTPSCGARLRESIEPNLVYLARSHGDKAPALFRAIITYLPPEERDYYFDYSFLEAFGWGRLESVEVLLQYGFWPNTLHWDFHMALRYPEVVRMLLDAAVARGAEFMASQLPKARVIRLLTLAARQHATAAYGKEEKKQSAHMLLEHLLQRPGVHPCLMRLYSGYRGDSSDAEPTEAQDPPGVPTHGLWEESDGEGACKELLEALSLLNETPLREAVVQLSESTGTV